MSPRPHLPVFVVHARPRLHRGWLLLLLSIAFALGCQHSIERPERPQTRVEIEQPALPTPFDSPPPLLGHGFGEPAEGESQRLYYVPKGKGQLYIQMVQELFPETAFLRQYPNFLQDSKGGVDVIVVRDQEDRVNEIEDFLSVIETSLSQVEVEAMILEIVNSDEVQLGATTSLTEEDTNAKTLFDNIQSVVNSQAFLDSLLPGNTGGFQGGLFNLGTIQDETIIDIVIEALVRDERTEIVSTPRLRVLSGYTASIITGEEVPVQQVQIVNNTTNFTTVFKKTGISLDITPHVVGNGQIRMYVKPEVSVVNSFTDPAVSGGLSNPIISTRSAETSVMIPSGHTLIIGGLDSTNEVEVKSRVPLLGSIPGIKYLFSSRRSSIVKTRLLFFIKVHITSNDAKRDTVLPLPE